jgi:hypothetical protein
LIVDTFHFADDARSKRAFIPRRDLQALTPTPS